MNDSDLLQAYVATKSEDAFAELVRRHVDLVFSAALRQVGGDAHLAQDVAQTVFNDLARKAGSLSSRTVLSGWLYTSARFAAAKIVRTEQRRVARERESQFMNPPDQTDPPDWDRLQTVLDDAMHDLKDADRNAVLLRYFKGCSFEDVGKNIGVSRDSARMRVDRALEKLRKCLAKRGVMSSSAALAVVLTQQTISAAPVGLAAIVASSAVSAASVGNQVQNALRKFAEANGDALPNDLSQLQPYFDQPVDAAMLARYKMIQGGGKYTESNPESNGALVEEIATPVDQEYDTLYQFYRNGSSSRSFNAISDALENATRRYAEANNGQIPRNASQLAAFLTKPVDQQRIDRFLAKIPLDVTTLDQLARRTGDKLFE